MKKIILLFLFLLIRYCFIYGQLPDSITKSTTVFGKIISDYGQRHYSNSPLHNVIDYECGLGVEAYAVESGDIIGFGGPWTTGTSNIKVKSTNNIWRYLHVESGTFTYGGNPLWEYCPHCLNTPGVNYDDFIFLRYIDNSGKLRTQAILTTTAYKGPIWNYTDITGDNVAISTTINTSDWIFLPGDYRPDYGIHLHIDNGYGKRINPLKLIAHLNNAAPNITGFRN